MVRKVTKKNIKTKSESSYISKLDNEVKSNQSRLSMVLGILIVLVIGILIFNYFQKGKDNLGPAQQTEQTADVSPESLPGKYTVKEGDTLFSIAQNYYQDGYKFTEIAKANNITDVNAIEKDQVLEIPKLTEGVAQALSPSSSPSLVMPSASPSQSLAPVASSEPQQALGTGTGGGDTTIWGPAIHEDTYTVVEGDWLSKIAGRAYGDVFAYTKIAQANNIQNPDLILPGQVLKIPR